MLNKQYYLFWWYACVGAVRRACASVQSMRMSPLISMPLGLQGAASAPAYLVLEAVLISDYLWSVAMP